MIAGQGTAFAFILVALAFLGLFLLGWRLAARLVSPVPYAVPRPHGGPLIQEDAVSTRPPLPPFSDETARQKVQAAEDAGPATGGSSAPGPSPAARNSRCGNWAPWFGRRPVLTGGAGAGGPLAFCAELVSGGFQKEAQPA